MRFRPRTDFITEGDFIIPPPIRRELVSRHDDNPAVDPAVTRDGIKYTAAVTEDMDGNRKFKVRREGVSHFTYRPADDTKSGRGAATQRRK